MNARKAALAAVVIAMVGATACSSSKPAASSTSSSNAPVAQSSSSAPLNIDYSTKFFDPPLDFDLPSFVDPTPSDENAAFVTWGAPDGSVAIRVLRPVVVYKPGATTTDLVPTDYVQYLLGQTDHGAHFADRADTKVDGHTTTVLTGTTDQPIDGSLGCPDRGIAADTCFGLQPEFSLRIAVITTDKGPLLIWLRSNTDAPADVSAANERLDSVLKGVRFATRPVTTRPPVPVDTEYDGTYTWTITKEDALAHGTPSDQTPEGLAIYPNTLTATLKNGRLHIVETSTHDVEDGPFEASSGHLFLGDHSNGLSADVIRDADGTLHLTAVPPILDAGGVFVLTTEPWTPVK